MSKWSRKDSRGKRAKVHSLPRREDFITLGENWSGHPEQVEAWENFGGKTVEEAYEKFCENPLWYQESFTRMGAVAFSFYLPVLDRCIRSLPAEELDRSDSSLESLASAIDSRLKESEKLRPQQDLLLQLCDYVCRETAPLGEISKAREKVRVCWEQLRQKIVECFPKARIRRPS